MAELFLNGLQDNSVISKIHSTWSIAWKNFSRKASKVPVGSDGLLFLPYLLGERAPIWNANAQGSIILD